jgi:hypothetical protein
VSARATSTSSWKSNTTFAKAWRSGPKIRASSPAEHHLLIINEIESFLEGEDEVLLLFAPPGSAKSRIEPSLASRLESDTHLNQRVIIETGDAEKRALLGLKLLSSQRERSKPVAREEIPRSRPLGAM